MRSRPLTESALLAFHLRRALGQPVAEPAVLDDARVSCDEASELFEETVRRKGPLFPFELVCMPASEMRSVILSACISASTLREALGRLIRYWPLVTEAFSLRLSEDQGGARLVADAAPRRAGEQHVLEFHLADIALSARTLAGVAPQAIHWAHASAADPAQVSALLGVPVRFGAPRSEVLFAAETLERKLSVLPPAGARVALAVADTLIEKRARPPTVTERARAVVEELLSSGAPIEAVARRCGLSTRSLNRALQAEGTSFRELRDRVRGERAERLLQRPDLGLDAIAAALGFSDARAFQRAFKRLTGKTPGRARRP